MIAGGDVGGIGGGNEHMGWRESFIFVFGTVTHFALLC